MKQYKSRICFILIMGFLLLGVKTVFSEPSSKGNAINPAVQSVEGTVWSGYEPDGDFYEFHFLKGGQLKFKTDTSGRMMSYTDKEDQWAQHGSTIMIVTTYYATRLGTIEGDHMEGIAWNFAGKRWRWMVDKQ